MRSSRIIDIFDRQFTPGYAVLLQMVLAVFYVVDGSTDYQLWYSAPATIWRSQCLPIGNGSLGGMIYGGVASEHIQFNEITLWTGGTTTEGTGNYLGFGDLYVDITNASAAQSDYRRDLDIGEALAHVSYSAGSVAYRREYFASFPDSVIAGHFTCSSAGGLSLTVRVTPLSGLTSTSVTASGNVITFSGYENSGGDLARLNFEAQVLVKTFGGTAAAQGAAIKVTGADSIDLILAAATDFFQSSATNWRGALPHATVSSRMAAASAKSYAALRAGHIADYQRLFNRFSLDLKDSVNKGRATDVRRSAYTVDAGNDRGLDVLFTQYGRYLIIASSRNSLPANLQGLWNDALSPQWRSDYHSDINVTMNYSHVEPLNVTECLSPFINFVDAQRSVRRARTAAKYPGVRGWTIQTETNHMGGNSWEWNNPGSAWYCNLLWDHFLFTQDTAYLRTRALPIMKEVCQFWQDHLVKSTSGITSGKLVTPDGWSPENGPNGNVSYREAGTAYDQQLVGDIFSNYSSAESVCAVDPAYRRAVDSLLALLDNGFHTGSGGDLLEWPSGAAGETNHRHLSHLVGLYPGSQISPLSNSTYANAALQALTKRGDGSTGWSCAWRADCWARLLNGAKAYHQLGLLIKNYAYGNLLDNCNDVFQIDGNCGGPSAVAEMLLQSHLGEISFLPALPPAWPNGSARGLCARGAFEVDFSWGNSKFAAASILSKKGNRCILRGTGYYVYDQDMKAVSCSTSTDRTSFATSAGSRYAISLTPAGVRKSLLDVPSFGYNREHGFAVKTGRFYLPVCPAGKVLCIAVYDLGGRSLGRFVPKGAIVDLKKDLGIRRQIVIVKMEVR
jgi:alpha-L-fucosidase 2